MAKIQKWYGRLGNNVLQIGNALAVAYINKSVFSCPTNKLFSAFSVPFGFTPSSKGDFFHLDLNSYGDAGKFKALRSSLLQEHFLPRLNLPGLSDDISALLKTGALVTHARGGDTFDEKPHGAYVSHPLDYYLHLAKFHEKIILVYEDSANPVVNALSKNPQFYLSNNDILTDYAIFTKAKAVALGGFGTFVPSACLLNKDLSKIYFSNVSPLDEYLPDSTKYEKIFLNLTGYIELGQWVADSTQINLMLHYKIPSSQ
jgi:hypothetical protein